MVCLQNRVADAFDTTGDGSKLRATTHIATVDTACSLLPACPLFIATVLLAVVSMQSLVSLALLCRLSAPLTVCSLSGPPAAGAEIDAWDLNGNGKIDWNEFLMGQQELW